jgi:hypothetical protein
MLKPHLIRGFILVACLAFPGFFALAQEQQHKREHAPPNAKVYFTGIADGATVPSHFTIHFGAENIEISPAGTDKPNSGHHHVLIDSPLPSLDAPIPSDPNHLHFGRGQSEGEIILPAGDHTLQLLLGDGAHFPHDPPVMSDVLHVHVDAASVEKARTPSPPNASVFFVDLQDGATIPTKSVVKFGIAGIGLAPAGTDSPGTGHHHLIVDAPLPPLDREIPSDLNYMHFGRAQTEATLTLAPGPHTLQLLLGDYQHVPHDPPVMSKVIHVVAADQGAAAGASPSDAGRTPSPPDAAVYFIYPRNGEAIYPSSTIRFGLRNMGVAPAGVNKANTGHHHLLIDAPPPALDQAIPSDLNHLHFGAGQTEKKIALKPGKHTLQLVLGDYRHVPHDPPVVSERIEVIVMGPKHKKYRRR